MHFVPEADVLIDNGNAAECHNKPEALGVRLWFAPSSEIPIYRQLVTQIILAILSNDLRPGDRLPSTRELARRFGIHPNTVSAGYRQLEREGWTEHRRGSGVHVRDNAEVPSTPEQILDQHIAGFFRAVRELNLPSAAIRKRVAEWLVSPPPDHFLLIDPDPEMRQILITEIGTLSSFPVIGGTLKDCTRQESLTAAVPLCRPSKTRIVRAALPSGVELITLQIRSANTWLGPWLPALKGQLVGIASHWPEFLQIARTMLIAAGLSPEALISRDARAPRWNRGLDQAAAIICDAYTASGRTLPTKARTIIFPLLADSAKAELSRFSGPPAL
jgi:DNA-binding transcriptional regulator YhcF (GntR family)